MNTAILFDVDNTLTPPRYPISNEMVEVLKKICVPFHIAAGSHMEILEEQFFTPLYFLGFRGTFNAFLSNGAIHYFCDYTERMDIKVISNFNIRNYLGEIDYNQIIKILGKTMLLPEFQMPNNIKLLGEQIVFRNSMINLCPIGRVKDNPSIYYINRNKFIEFDNKFSYRLQIMEHLKKELAYYTENNNLTVTLGGETSFDIGILNQDKTKAVRKLLNQGVERLIFIGDALFEGGNDASIQAFADNWNIETKCPLETIQVNCWKDTIDELYALGFVPK